MRLFWQKIPELFGDITRALRLVRIACARGDAIRCSAITTVRHGVTTALTRQYIC